MRSLREHSEGTCRPLRDHPLGDTQRADSGGVNDAEGFTQIIGIKLPFEGFPKAESYKFVRKGAAGSADPLNSSKDFLHGAW